MSAPSIVSGTSGESEKSLRDTFEEAKKIAPCILFIDEIDAITPKRETAQREMERRIVAQLLTCMDGLDWEKSTDGRPVMVLGATNRPDSLDPALRRAGRFDHEIAMGVPNEQGREQILQVLCSKLRIAGDFDLRYLAKRTPGYVGADLTSLTAAAGIIAVKRIFQDLANADTAMQCDADEGDKAPESAAADGATEAPVDGAAETPAADAPAADAAIPRTDVERAASVALGAAASKAYVLASYEERECQRLVQQIIEAQLKKMQLKMAQFEELETLLDAERRSIEAGRKQLYADRLAVQRQLAAVNELLRKASTAPQDVRPDEVASVQSSAQGLPQQGPIVRQGPPAPAAPSNGSLGRME